QHDPRTLVVVGGVHVTLNGDDLVPTRADAIVRGEGALTFGRLVEAYESDGMEGVKGVEGVRVREGDRFTEAALPPYPHPDRMPFARRELTRKWWPDYYYIYHNPCHLLKTAWGCPYTCSFCYCWRATGGHYAYRSPESVVDELERMWSSSVYIVDDDFFLHPTRLMEIHDLIVKRGIKKTYFAYARSDFIAAHPEVVQAWSRIGLSAIVLGVESDFEEDLAYFGKESSAQHNVRAFEVLREANVDPYASFILNPGWGLREFARLQRYIYDNRLYYVILQPLMPLPGTAIWDQWSSTVIIDRDHHEMWDISHLALPSRLPMKTYFREMVKLYLRTCLNLLRLPGVNLRTLPTITSPAVAQIPKVLAGGLRVCWQLWNAHERYRPGEVARYERGREIMFGQGQSAAAGPAQTPCDYKLVQRRIEMAEAAGGVAPPMAHVEAGRVRSP
ncbi:MAG: radical SAM protein, partial [Candidatus Riflebacteria bacterium]|nr:radical SAM protein [Candidatus Riflebacteria bacterium]